MKPSPNLYPGTTLVALALSACCIVLFRAWNQDLTIDEANTYHFYISKLSTDFWWAGSNNHLLSTLLIRISTSLFGYSPFAMRLPAVIGGMVYAGCAAILVAMLIDKSRVWIRVILYILLVFNPFIMDYLVAARGYSPALACEMAMLLFIYRQTTRPFSADSASPLILISILGALAVAFNYSFLFTVSSLLFFTFVFVAGRAFPAPSFPWGYLLPVAARLFIPFAAILYLICSNNIMTMPQKEIQIGWGSDSFVKMVASFAQLTFNHPNPFLTPPGIRHVVNFFSLAAPWLTVLLFASSLLWLANRWRFYAFKTAHGLSADLKEDRFAWLLLAALILSLAMHLFLFYVLGVKLPLSRTGIHLIPLITLLATVPLYVMVESKNIAAVIAARLGVVGAGLVAITFVFALHLAYFQEWKWNADTCAATDMALTYADRLHTNDIRVSWEFDAAGNYYGDYLGYGAHRLANPPEKQLMVTTESAQPTVFILSQRAWDAVDTRGLTQVYRSPLSGAIVALRNADDIGLPATPVPFQADLHARCRQHDWAPHSAAYPGSITY